MIEQHAQEHVEELSLIVENVEESEAVDLLEHQAQERSARPEAAQPVEHQAQADHRNNSEEEEDFAQVGPQPVNFSSPQEDFDVVSELKTVKRVVESLESKVDMVRDDQTYMKHDSDIFRRSFYNKMDEVVTSINTSHTALETNLVRQFTESQQHITIDLDFVKFTSSGIGKSL
ncbi:hypothetical protein F511_12647 [Dorcoceras hygrometricum]|uniref:Uncharacterized protein n=1 Tax=Dorcoceras hygrometricum TaxID=472368 RepID=A0A2Z7C8T7_9LAMI|nr:hypothetical protein F511_12647 [Dorcoceras hygrometricum]